MAKGGLSNNLLGKKVRPKYMEEQAVLGVTDGRPLLGPWPSELKPNLSGEYIAEIMAAWVHAGEVKVALIDPFGHTAEAYLVNVNIVTG